MCLFKIQILKQLIIESMKEKFKLMLIKMIKILILKKD